MKIECGLVVWPETGVSLVYGGFSLEMIGDYFSAMWKYHQHGITAVFNDPFLKMAWAQTADKIDRDNRRAAWESIGKQFKAFQKEFPDIEVKKDEWARRAWPEAYALYKGNLHGIQNAENVLTAKETVTLFKDGERVENI